MRGVEQIPWVYDALCAVFERVGLRRWRQWLVGSAQGRVLEVGVGTGRNLPHYPAGAEVVALEPSADTLQRARRRAPQVAFVRGSAEALPFRDGAFDQVISGLVFCSVPDPARGLGEVRRVLSPGGELRMVEHVRSRTRLGGWWQDLIQPAWTRLSGGCHPNRDTERAVQTAGFEVDAATYRARGNLRRFAARAVRY